MLALSGFSVNRHGFRDGLPAFIVWHINGSGVDVTAATDQPQTALADEAYFRHVAGVAPRADRARTLRPCEKNAESVVLERTS